MRALLFLLVIAIPAASAAPPLFFVGTGDDYVIITEPDPSPALFKSSNFGMSAEGHGGAATTYETHPGNDVDENGLIPTFIYEGAPVVLAADDVVTVHHFASMNGGGGVGPGCGLTAHMYDAEGNVIAEQFVASDTTTPGVQEFVFEISGVEGEFSKFKFQMVQTGSGTGGSDICGNMGITHHWGSDDAPGRVVLPADGTSVPLVTTHYEDLGTPEVMHAFSNATSDTYVLNFTNDFEDVVAAFAWNATNGTVDVVLNGPDGTLFEGLFDGSGSQEEVFEGVATGPWNLSVTYTDFAGSFDFSLQEPAEDGGGDGGDGAGDGSDGDDAGDGGDGGDGAGDGNATGNETLDDTDAGKDSPGPALPLLVGLVAAVAMARRRR